jgi:TonB family protein
MKREAPALTPVTVQPVRVERRSRVELDSSLSARGWAEPLDVPSVTHSNLLGSTEVQVSVEPDGRVFSAVVVQGSGWRVADERALDLARHARFAPVEPSLGSRQWGRIRFRWYVVEPGAAVGGTG